MLLQPFPTLKNALTVVQKEKCDSVKWHLYLVMYF